MWLKQTETKHTRRSLMCSRKQKFRVNRKRGDTSLPEAPQPDADAVPASTLSEDDLLSDEKEMLEAADKGRAQEIST